MLRGFISGSLWGGVVSALVLAVTSLNSEPPPGNRPPLSPLTTAPDLQPGAGDLLQEGGDAVPGGSTDAGGAPAPSETPEVSNPSEAPAGIAALPDADTAPPAVPQTGDVDHAIAEPAAPRSAPVLGGSSDEPAPVIAETEAPPAPETDAAPEADQASADPVSAPADVSTDAPAIVAPETSADAPSVAETDAPAPVSGASPGAPAQPDAQEPAAALSEAPESAPPPEADTDIALAPAPQATPAAPQVPSLPEEGAVEAETPDIAPPAIDDLPPRSPGDPSPDGGAVLVEVPETAPEPTTEASVAPEVLEIAPEAPEIAPPAADATDEAAPDEDDAPRITLRGSDAALPAGSAEIRVIRPDSEAAAEDEAPVAEASSAAIADPDTPALVAHAAKWAPEVPDLPLLSVIMMDEGGLGEAGPAAVSSIPFPVSVAIDATRPDAAARIAAYRELGIEVLAIARLPDGATPQDAEVILGASFDAARQTIGLLDPGDGGLQGDRDVTGLAMARLASEGRGFVTASRGLNTALRLAEAEGVAAGVLYRDLDSEGQDARVIRRFLDQAAFRARQQSGVILLARVRPDTISALTLWGTANRASQVELAPVSAVLRGP
ncbi:divergent polysaccharide deacetylase family protein [Ponticoccus sp. SC2-23]|uniref:polysaccharide deacteylase family 2 protein n=1 Tax=Alexandriicola marinus TaxID=2081710 RepID=UPI000FDC4C7D|nr:polysaccharide deacteylase family 2 protein [Alexandriicola marinus]MBM1219234.1 divergent polysaccharide deacetylase family protein [Ponticoccus sp. SC6-9]MBM1223694.1 divergent polysaccharide deacetylase family protein [Ponticoccus sp. SC6-15]MBM1232660.1 divergent polysaccharide deacetylase family protein [Ponticoccus sp. SC6-45]MBM1237390.1 divergent polysaccharide deacetylase family protein [Ponticoccus sp. SC6-49]MBM1241671.1 divergent polysaccharide deacetylase family protein [Pontic